MKFNDILALAKLVILSWQVLAIIIVVALFIALVCYVAGYHKEVLDYSIPVQKIKNIKKKDN